MCTLRFPPGESGAARAGYKRDFDAVDADDCTGMDASAAGIPASKSGRVAPPADHEGGACESFGYVCTYVCMYACT